MRFATQKYTTQSKLVKKRFIHLTNFAVNKKNTEFQYNEEADVSYLPKADDVGSKWSLMAYKKKLRELGVDTHLLFGKIKEILIKTCIAVEPQYFNSVARYNY